MRSYLKYSNLSQAITLGGCVTLMSIPRLDQGGTPQWLYVAIAFLCLTLVAGAATAWGSCGGLVGLFPVGRRLAIGLGAALIGGLALFPVYTQWLDPWLKEALMHAGDADRLQLQFPDTLWKQVAVVLWIAGFQVLFFNAAAMSFFCRLTGRISVAIALAVALRVCVSYIQFASISMDNTLPFHVVHGLTCAIACLLFARAGLLPTSLFAAVPAMRHLWWG